MTSNVDYAVPTLTPAPHLQNVSLVDLGGAFGAACRIGAALAITISVVLDHRTKKEMFGVYARGIIATMADANSWRDRLLECLKRISVSANAPPPNYDGPVVLGWRKSGADPQPAAAIWFRNA